MTKDHAESLRTVARSFFEPHRKSQKKLKPCYYGDWIPPQKLGDACRAYVSKEPDEKALLLLTDTVFGSGEEGFVLTDKALYTNLLNTTSGKQEVSRTALSDLASVVIDSGLLFNGLLVNGVLRGSVTQTSRALNKLLNEFFASAFPISVAEAPTKETANHSSESDTPVEEAGGGTSNLSQKTVKSLREMAKAQGVRGYSKMTKAVLIQTLNGVPLGASSSSASSPGPASKQESPKKGTRYKWLVLFLLITALVAAYSARLTQTQDATWTSQDSDARSTSETHPTSKTTPLPGGASMNGLDSANGGAVVDEADKAVANKQAPVTAPQDLFASGSAVVPCSTYPDSFLSPITGLDGQCLVKDRWTVLRWAAESLRLPDGARDVHMELSSVIPFIAKWESYGIDKKKRKEQAAVVKSNSYYLKITPSELSASSLDCDGDGDAVEAVQINATENAMKHGLLLGPKPKYKRIQGECFRTDRCRAKCETDDDCYSFIGCGCRESSCEWAGGTDFYCTDCAQVCERPTFKLQTQHPPLEPKQPFRVEAEQLKSLTDLDLSCTASRAIKDQLKQNRSSFELAVHFEVINGYRKVVSRRPSSAEVRSGDYKQDSTVYEHDSGAFIRPRILWMGLIHKDRLVASSVHGREKVWKGSVTHSEYGKISFSCDADQCTAFTEESGAPSKTAVP
jgi:hypothetical protein